MTRAITALRMVVRALRGDDSARYFLAEKLTHAIYPAYVFSEYGREFLRDTSFKARYESLEGTSNYRSLDRKYVLDQLVQLACLVDGDTAECGVLRGTSSLFLCERIANSGKEHHVFDSFEGLSEPTAGDGSYWTKGDLAVDEAAVRANLAAFDFVRYHRGWIPERFEDVADRRFSFVHVDVDLEQPTLDSIAFFYPRLSSGGILLCDDYGFSTCPGAKRAMDEFMADKPESVVHLPTGQGFVIRASTVPSGGRAVAAHEQPLRSQP